MGMRWYVRTLEQTVIETLAAAEFNLAGFRSPHTGVWVNSTNPGMGECKICAMGVHNSDLVTSHGLALNCNVNLDWFGHIVPCGIPDKGVTSLSSELNKNITVQDVEPILIENFEKNFCTS